LLFIVVTVNLFPYTTLFRSVLLNIVEVIDMKFGMRKPSLKRSVKAQTTGKIKRKAKSTINPIYDKKGSGWVRNPEKAAYNKVYRKTSFGLFDLLKKLFK